MPQTFYASTLNVVEVKHAHATNRQVGAAVVNSDRVGACVLTLPSRYAGRPLGPLKLGSDYPSRVSLNPRVIFVSHPCLAKGALCKVGYFLQVSKYYFLVSNHSLYHSFTPITVSNFTCHSGSRLIIITAIPKLHARNSLSGATHGFRALYISYLS